LHPCAREVGVLSFKQLVHLMVLYKYST
jgi:hypothetical protein